MTRETSGPARWSFFLLVLTEIRGAVLRPLHLGLLLPGICPAWYDHSAADPGFLIKGCQSHCGGSTDLRHRRFLVEMYAKMNELGPVGGHAVVAPPGSANAIDNTCEI